MLMSMVEETTVWWSPRLVPPPFVYLTLWWLPLLFCPSGPSPRLHVSLWIPLSLPRSVWVGLLVRRLSVVLHPSSLLHFGSWKHSSSCWDGSMRLRVVLDGIRNALKKSQDVFIAAILNIAISSILTGAVCPSIFSSGDRKFYQ